VKIVASRSAGVGGTTRPKEPMPQPVPHRSTLRLAVALLVASVAAGAPAAEPAALDAGPVPPAPVPAGAPRESEPMPPIGLEGVTEPAPPPAAGLPGAGDTWLDATHSFLGSVFATVLKFDRFFSDETELELERARSFLRWRNDLRYGEDTQLTYLTTLRADLKLPGLNKVLRRMRLVVSGETEDTLATLFPDREGEGGGAVPTAEVGRADAELRYGIVETLRTHISLGGGVLLQLPPGVRGRVRIRHAFPVSGSVLVRLGSTAFWDSLNGFGDTMQADFERRFGANTLVRWQNGATISEFSRGWEWGTGASVLQQFGRRTAIAAGGGVIGWTEPFPEVTRRRLFLRFRRDVFRRWLFYEVEPEILWPVVDGRTLPSVLGVIARLEIQFHGAELLSLDSPPTRASPVFP
jgi:hypothetical protein